MITVYLIGEPYCNWHAFRQFVQDEQLPESVAYTTQETSDAEQIVEMAGRLCYMSYGNGRSTTAAFMQNIIGSQHFSVLEHANWTFIITGISRSCSHELVRHRHLSFSQLSQRYVPQHDLACICPKELEDAGHKEDFDEVMSRVLEFYSEVSEDMFQDTPEMTTAAKKRIRTAARAILPNSIETKIAVTGNARAWREFIAKRNVPAADPEIRELARTIADVLSKNSPLLFGDLTPEDR
jgi:thymidylate synthase (FAD)